MLPTFDEVKNLGISSVIIAIIFSIRNFSQFLFFFSSSVIILFVSSSIAKIVANKMKAKAILKIHLPGSLAGLILSLLGMKFCPVVSLESYGYKFGRWNRKFLWLTPTETGIISASFIISILMVSSIFFFIGFKEISLVGFWLSVSLLLPFRGLEGERILKWNFGIWVMFLILSVLAIVMITWI